jgi:hypothetical protein
MDEAIIEVYGRMRQEAGVSVDDILDTPERREAFLAATRQLLGNLPEHELLHRLLYLRKRGRLTFPRLTTPV